MAQLLTTKFQFTTGRGLSNDNLNYLASKVFGEYKVMMLSIFSSIANNLLISNEGLGLW
jgi:hypothetical protein